MASEISNLVISWTGDYFIDELGLGLAGNAGRDMNGSRNFYKAMAKKISKGTLTVAFSNSS